MDVHIPTAVSEQLRLRGVDVLTATEEAVNRLPDNELLSLATSLRRVLITFDIRFRAMAESWQREGREFSGLGFARPDTVSIGQLVRDLELIAKASDSTEWFNAIFYLPLR